MESYSAVLENNFSRVCLAREADRPRLIVRFAYMNMKKMQEARFGCKRERLR